MVMTRKTRFARRTPTRRVRKSKTTAIRSKAFVSRVKSVIRREVEKKYLKYGPAASIGVPSTGALLSMVDVTQGNGDTQRIGDSLYVRSLEFNFNLANGDSTNFLRCILFQWKPNINGNPAVGDLLLDSSDPINSPYNHDKRYQFKVIYDKTYLVDAVQAPVKHISWMFTRGFSRKVQYVGGASTEGSNRLFIYIFSDSSAIPHPTLAYTGKLSYSDL